MSYSFDYDKYKKHRPSDIRDLISDEYEYDFADEFDYVFLSPVFDSISKAGYKAGFSMEELQEASSRGIIDEKVVALGGVTFDSIPYLKRLGFGGAAMIGSIYNAEALEYLELMGVKGIR